jgi:hypothetical protein
MVKFTQGGSLVYEATVTDTFGGEANYAWVKRVEFTMPEGSSPLAVVRKAKKLLGYNGVKMRKQYDGCYDVVGACIRMFIE